MARCFGAGAFGIDSHSFVLSLSLTLLGGDGVLVARQGVRAHEAFGVGNFSSLLSLSLTFPGGIWVLVALRGRSSVQRCFNTLSLTAFGWDCFSASAFMGVHMGQSHHIQNKTFRASSELSNAFDSSELVDDNQF